MARTHVPGSGQDYRKRGKQQKVRKSSPLALFALALLFLAGFLTAAGWLFREPLMAMVHRFMPGTEEQGVATPVIPSLPAANAEAAAAEPSTKKAAPLVGAPPVKPAVPPEPTMPASVRPPEAKPAEKILAATPKPAANAEGSSIPPPSVAVPPAGALVEVPAKKAAPATPETAPEISTPTLAGEPVLKISAELPTADQEAAREAAADLVKFLNAKNLGERLRYTLGADQMQPLMERYYTANPDGPITVDSMALVRLDHTPQIGGGAHAVFGVESKNWEFPIPVMLEASPEGYRVDWLSFVEFKDRVLEKFFQGYQEGRARFHVGITRQHYFGDDVPDATGKEAFRLGTAPPNPFLTTVFLNRSSELSQELRDKVSWGAQVWAIVELEWVKSGAQQWVELAAIPQLNWYSVPTNIKGLSPSADESGVAPKALPADSAEPPAAAKRPLPMGR